MSWYVRKSVYLHLAGAGCSILSITLNGAISHDTGIAIAVGIVTLLGVQELPAVDRPETLERIIGTAIDGGMRQGQFIKLCFAVALLTSGSVQQFLRSMSGTPTLLLGIALTLSAVANELEIRELRDRHQ